MAKIAISINEVLRDFVGQFTYTYKKYIDETFDLKEGEAVDFDFSTYFKFPNKNEFNKFLYAEHPLEVFGHADQIIDITKFNNFVMDIKDEEEHTVALVTRDVDKSIPATFFFLSKTGCKIPQINFVQEDQDEWIDADVLVTANPIALANKPDGKISVKVNASYNKDVAADFSIDSILDFIKDDELRNTILNTKITTYANTN